MHPSPVGKSNHRLRANHDQIQLDINDKVPKSRLPKDTRPVPIERVLPDGRTVVETVEREVIVPYTKITTMPTQDFIAWLRHIADPETPPESQFYFSAELRRAKDAGASMPITVPAALDWPPRPEAGPPAAAGVPRSTKPSKSGSAQGSGSLNTQDPASKKSRSRGGQAKQKQDTRKAKATAKETKKPKKGRKRSANEEDEESDTGEEFTLPESDDTDDIPETTLAKEPTKGNRHSERIKGKEKEVGWVEKQIDVVATTTNDEPGNQKDKTADKSQKQRLFLSSVSIMTPARRPPGVFSLSPTADPLDAPTVNRVSRFLYALQSWHTKAFARSLLRLSKQNQILRTSRHPTSLVITRKRASML